MSSIRKVIRGIASNAKSAVHSQRSLHISVYGGQHTVSVLPGDGASQEIMNQTLKVIKASKAPVHFDVLKFNPRRNCQKEYETALLSFKRNGVALKGAWQTNYKDPEFKAYNALLRKDLGLEFNVVHVKSEGTEVAPSFDVIIIRQNTSGEYSLAEHSPVEDVVESLKVVTSEETRKIAHFAFKHALEKGRKQVTCVHKANIQKLSDGLFLETVREVSKEYPEIKFRDLIVDNTAMQMVSDPGQFDVILTTNLYGNICQNIACGLAGGPGLFSGVNMGDDLYVFEPATRSPGMCVESNQANPTAMIKSGVEMLKHLGLEDYASIISSALEKTIHEDGISTSDVGGNSTCEEVVDSVINRIKASVL